MSLELDFRSAMFRSGRLEHMATDVGRIFSRQPNSVKIRLAELRLNLLRAGVRLPCSAVLPIALDCVDETKLLALAAKSDRQVMTRRSRPSVHRRDRTQKTTSTLNGVA
jgi:hypothetical protein